MSICFYMLSKNCSRLGSSTINAVFRVLMSYIQWRYMKHWKRWMKLHSNIKNDCNISANVAFFWRITSYHPRTRCKWVKMQWRTLNENVCSWAVRAQLGDRHIRFQHRLDLHDSFSIDWVAATRVEILALIVLLDSVHALYDGC